MDLKEFIKETLSAIVEAVAELQEEHEDKGVVFNPPLSAKERDLYRDKDPNHLYRRVEPISFDVGVTASSESVGGGKAGLRVLIAEASVDGTHSRSNEKISRVSFSIPLVLPASGIERENREAHEKQRAETAAKMKERPARKDWLA